MKLIPEEPYFEGYRGDACDALHDAYVMLRDRGYSPGDLAPLREVIITETHFGPNALVSPDEADWIEE